MIRTVAPPISAVQTKRMTTDEFENFLRQPENRDQLVELINGEIVEKMPTEEHGEITTNIVVPLGAFVRKHNLGRVVVEVRYRVPRDQHNARQPDISFTRGHRPCVTQGAVLQMPDLAIEIQSPDDTLKAMREKAAYYLANGTRLVWLVFPKRRYVEVYRPDEEMEILFGSDVLEGGDILPGFILSLAEIFADPLA